MKKILFVDDEPLVLQGIKRSLRSMRDRWTMEFIEDPTLAIRELEKSDFDVVVSDMMMPKASGVDVLCATKKNCPQAVRIGLSGYANSELSFEAARIAHQYFAKPCDIDDLTSAIDAITDIQSRLNNPDVLRVMQKITSLPTIPKLYDEVTREAASESGSLDRVGNIIAKDPAMASKILQLVNSAHFGIATDVSSPNQATAILGFEAIRTLILNVHLFSTFDSTCERDQLDKIWNLSAEVSYYAAEFAKVLGLSEKAIAQSRLAGLLHNIGQLVIVSELPAANHEIKALVDQGSLGVEAEKKILGCDHTDIGAYILTLWGFTRPVIEAVAYYQQPSRAKDTSASVLTALCLGYHVASTDEMLDSSMEYLDQIGLTKIEIAEMTEQIASLTP